MPDPENTAAASTLAEYVNAVATEDVAHAASCAAEAAVLVNNAIGTDNPYVVPEEIVARCVLEVGSELYYRKSSRHGISSFDGIEGAMPLRISRDPMTAAWPLLRRFIPFGIG